MYFVDLQLSDDGVVTAKAKGHSTEVIDQFYKISGMLLSSRGSWRITNVKGTAPDEMDLDSDMRWTLEAKAKDRGV